jgi:hypothetical protein
MKLILQNTALHPPILRLRPITENEEIEKKRYDANKCPDGPWRRHPDEINETICSLSNADFPLDIDVENYRIHYQDIMATFTEYMHTKPRSKRSEMITVEYVSTQGKLVDMERMLGESDDEIEGKVEATFVHCDV